MKIAAPDVQTDLRTVRHPRRALARLAGAAAVLVMCAAAAAQPGQEGLQPPIPAPPLTAPSHPLQMAVGILLLILVIGANMIPSKRGHQD